MQFLPLVEDDDLAIEIGDYVIAQALHQGCVWRDAGYPLTLAVNLFARQLQRPCFVERLRAGIEREGCQGAPGLDLEITEHAALEGIPNIAELVTCCRDVGVRFALDDFGTGYSTLDHLRRIPAGVLKIDRSLIGDMLRDTEDRTLVSAIIGLGQSFRREVIAEGVEQPEQVRWLLASGCDIMQGRYFAEPMPADRFIAWLKDFRPDPTWTTVLELEHLAWQRTAN